MTEPLIQLMGVGKTYRSPFLRRPKVALTSLDLEVRAGEIFGFLGPNGAGKTTTIKILLGLVRPTRGTGTVLSLPFGSVDARRELGFLPDSPSFYRYLTAREYLRLVAELRMRPGAAAERAVSDTLARVHLLEEAWDRQLRTFSRGMLQRVGIGAAVLHKPRLVILDEPMNGLDPLGRHEFRDLILSLKAEGTAVFLSSHVLADIESTADRVAILHRGELLECGGLEEILSDGGRTIEITFELRGGVRPGEISAGIDEMHPGARGWIASVRDPDRACRVVQRILDSGGRVFEMGPRRISLEQFFMDRVAGTVAPAGTAPPSPRTHERAVAAPPRRERAGSGAVEVPR